MPTYEYRCKDCGHTFDAYQSFTDDPLTECPECAGAVKKVFGNVGISFKGSGFYKTDSRSGGASAANGEKKDASPATSSESSSGSEASSDPSSSASPSGTPSSGAPSPSSGSTGTKKESAASSTSGS